MSAADKLAQVLAEHQADYQPSHGFCCSCLEISRLPEMGLDATIAAHQAAVVLAHLTAEGWAQTVAEEWGVYRPELNDHNVINMGERGQADAVAKMSNRRESGRGSHVVRRRVTDWEPVEGEQP